jgi:predicted helicase
VNLGQSEFAALSPIVSRDAKSSRGSTRDRVIFKLYSLGVSTNRDEWVIDYSRRELIKKVRFLSDHYARRLGAPAIDGVIKWSESLLRRCSSRVSEAFATSRVGATLYRPFVERFEYQSEVFVDRPGLAARFFPPGKLNAAIGFMAGDRQPFSVIAAKAVPNLNMFSADAVQYVAFYCFADDGTRVENITDWALDQFRKHYRRGKGKKDGPITKEAIFHYVYGVLHDPIYREKYALNLKREFPRIPFYADFWQWAEWGERLMELHIEYGTVKPAKLRRIDVPDEKARAAKQTPKPLLRADKEAGAIVLDSETTLRGVPAAAWEYRLGNRSALEWILDQYKEKKPKDPTIREKFDTYRFADYKEKVIDLLARVTTVSVETIAIVQAMSAAKR